MQLVAGCAASRATSVSTHRTTNSCLTAWIVPGGTRLPGRELEFAPDGDHGFVVNVAPELYFRYMIESEALA